MNSIQPLGVPSMALRNLYIRSLSIALVFVLAGLFACRATPPPPPPPPDPVVVSVPPDWIDKPLSWQNLVRIEDWLETEAANHNAALRIEAQLRLNEGRVKYSQSDLDKGSAPAQTVRVRVEAARDGFKLILADTAASPSQKTRAKIGLQSALALLDAPMPVHTGIAMVDRAHWKAKPGRVERLTPLKGMWSRITVHHSADTLSEQSGSTLGDSEEVVRAIQKFHMEDPDHRWGDIGYHFLIDSGGRIFEGRELTWQGAHAGGSGGMNNTQNLGICMLGDFLKRPPTPAALKSLELLINSLQDQYKIPASRVFAHNYFTTTQCPGPALTVWLKKHY